MSHVIAIFGAGTGLGASVARRFGREGFQVALIARRPGRLDALVTELSEEGIAAAAFPADLADPSQVPAVVDAIASRFGPIDAVVYGPNGPDQPLVPATTLDAATLERLSRLLLLTPVEVVRAVLPDMIERGSGAILMTNGFAAVHPLPYLSGPAPLMAAARNYIHALNGELAGTGVYAGTVSIAAFIDRSEAATEAEARRAAAGMPDGIQVSTVDPDDLADLCWHMYQDRDRVEAVFPALAAA